MADRLINMTTAMALAARDGSKAETRRIAKQQEHITELMQQFEKNGIKNKVDVLEHGYGIKCPYGRPGDRLGVREAYFETGCWKNNGKTKGGRRKKMFVPANVGYSGFPPALGVWYMDAPPKGGYNLDGCRTIDVVRIYKRLGRFMPRKYVRTWLSVVSIGIERLQDITEEASIAEGVCEFPDGTYQNYFKEPGLREEDGVECLLAVGSFQSLFCSINGRNIWDENPWVWVVKFKRV